MNHFELFGYAAGPVVDRSDLTRRYVALQRQVHPDRFVGEGGWAQEEAEQASARVNEAYRIFGDPDHTLEYFLETMGYGERGESSALPPAFLMEVMDVNELLDEGDEAAFRARIGTLSEGIGTEIAALVAQWEGGDVSPVLLERLRDLMLRKRYVVRLLDRLKP